MASSQKKRLVIGNWKMYVESPLVAKELARALRRKATLFSGTEVVVAPAFPLIPAVAAALKGSKIAAGAQSLSMHGSGAHTGEVSAGMLKGAGVSYVIVGHSERRAAGEGNDQVQQQAALAAAAGLRVVLCIGEEERDQAGTYFELLTEQLSIGLAAFPKTAAAKLVIAYEPVWAIGKTAAEAMKPSDVRETAIFIRKILVSIFGREAALRIPVLYGGSVDPSNAGSLIEEGDIAGFLVGRASADPKSFLEIVQACTPSKQNRKMKQ